MNKKPSPQCNFTDTIIFTGKNSPTAEELYLSLLGLHQIGRKVPIIINNFHGAHNISKAEIRIQEILQGSLHEKLFTTLFFKDEAGLNAFIQKISQTSLQDLAQMSPELSIGIVIGAAVAYGTMRYFDKRVVSPGVYTQVKGNYNRIINVTSSHFGMDAEKVQEKLASAIKDPDQMTKQAVKFLSPAQSDPGDGVLFDPNGNLIITAETLAELPRDITEIPEEVTEVFDDTPLEFRALDLDKKTGWAAIAEEISKSRVKLEIAPSIDKDRLFQKGKTRGRVAATYRMAGDGSKRLISLYLESEN